ncbi:RagB/SusD family nutrient uptake outer membrane protein [Catalinimonas sp. 4WD22]|uniref:RagB/SusD family nutrient uptake outer membrane protein n=1 Tax=Catalinimonas locisalis TaxID=3133978 RepID=UPI0031011247
MKKIFILTLSVLLGLSTSCDSVLEVEPVSQILAENFYSDADGAEAALMNAYDWVQNPVTQNFIIVPGIVSDEAIMTRGGNFTRHHNFVPTPVQGNVGDMWRNMYFGVQACNDVLENVPTIDDPALNADQVMGEAYFLRGMVFFYLTRLYGKIPLITEASKSANQDFNVPRNEVNEVFEQIISDLTTAEDLLGAESQNRARASKGAARAMLAKVYLYRNAPGDLELALAETEEVMADNQYQLVAGTDYASLFTVGQQNTSETIFELSYRPNTSVENQNLDRETVPFPNNDPRMAPTEKIIEAFNQNPEDLRLPVSLDTISGRTYIRKYQNAPADDVARGTQASNVIILRLADVILMRAEILNELGRTGEAIPFLNQIRERAGIGPTDAVNQDEVRLAIENERFLELAFEGQRWFDLIRTNRVVEVIGERLFDSDRILWPVPGRDIDLNPNLLPQNPSY